MELSKINCSKLRATALVQAIILSRYLFNIGFGFLNDQYSRYCSTQLKNTSKSLSVSSTNHWLLWSSACVLSPRQSIWLSVLLSIELIAWTTGRKNWENWEASGTDSTVTFQIFTATWQHSTPKRFSNNKKKPVQNSFATTSPKLCLSQCQRKKGPRIRRGSLVVSMI